MKKIMFNDKFGLTQAVLEGRKTMTRRIVNDIDLLQYLKELEDDGSLKSIRGTIISETNSRYKVGEVLAIAQSYKNLNELGYLAPEWLDGVCEDSAGYTNKMFVRADLMPHRIRITDIKVERLQDISYEDCLKEGVREVLHPFVREANNVYICNRIEGFYTHPKDCYADIIDKISGKGTWESNPFVFAYTFKLVD